MLLSITITRHITVTNHTVSSHTLLVKKKYNMCQPKMECSFLNLGEKILEHFYSSYSENHLDKGSVKDTLPLGWKEVKLAAIRLILNLYPSL